jgi:tetratricopeptide (TPR) repeat protein
MTALLFRRAFIGCTVAAVTVVTVHTNQAVPAETGHVPPSAASLRARGVEFGFNLDYPEALATFREAIAANPEDATAYRLAAATLWVSLLFQQGAVTVEDFLGQARTNLARKAPPSDVAATFHDYTNRAMALAEKRLRERPQDADAHFQVGAASGFQASYTATVEGRVLGGVGAARRAYSEHKRVMDIDPRRKDAGLIVGMYRYSVAALPFHMRLLARIAGFGSNRENGLRLVEEAARYPSDVQTNALFTLVLMYNREGRHLDALQIIRQLQAKYPRNRLLYLEAGSTALRAARPAEALDAIDAGLALCAKDPRPRAFGERARWRYYRGAALVGLHQTDAAERELRAMFEEEAHQWIRGRGHVELGKIADLRGNHAQALSEYQLAAGDCGVDRDTVCLDEARKFVTAGYR